MSKKKPQVLIIEDETALLYALNAELKIAGFDIITSADGQEGLEQMRKHQPDFVVLDIWLPTMDGLEILAAREKDPKLKKIPVLVVSNSGSDETIQETKKFGVVDYLVKSDHSVFEIAETIKKIVNK